MNPAPGSSAIQARRPACPGARGDRRGIALGLARALAIVLLALASSSVATAQRSDAAAALEEARRAADRAERAAAESRQLVEQIRSETSAATQADDETDTAPIVAPGAPPAPGAEASSAVAAPETGPLPADVEAAIAGAERAAREAEIAAREARAIAFQAHEALGEYRRRYARTGFLVGVGASYALEDFDTGLSVGNSRSGAAWIGYRVHPNVSVELRGELIDEFDVGGRNARDGALDVELDAFYFALGSKIYPLTGSVQPFVGFGLGVMRAEIDGTGFDGTPVNDAATEVVARLSGGLDLFVSENLVLNLEAAYLTPGGDLDGLDIGTLGGGLTFRF